MSPTGIIKTKPGKRLYKEGFYSTFAIKYETYDEKDENDLLWDEISQ